MKPIEMIKELKNKRPVTMRLPEVHYQMIKKLGGGNFARGMTIVLRSAEDEINKAINVKKKKRKVSQ